MNAVTPLRYVRDGGGGWRHVGGVADGVVRRIGLRAIRFHLDRAARSSGCEAMASIREAKALCLQLGLSWGRVVAVGHVLAEGAP